MKKLLSLTCLVLFSLLMFAQAPESFKYQSVVRDATGNILANQIVHFRINIHRSSASGTIVYAETHYLTTNSFGLANMEIGDGVVVTGNFANIDWASYSHYIQTELDATGGFSFVNMGTSQLLSVPYALNAKSVSGMEISDLTDVSTLTPSTDQVLKWNSTEWIPSSLNIGDLDNVSSLTPSTNQVLKWNGTQWLPATDQVGTSSSSPWIVSGTNIYRSTGNIGIGNGSPTYPLVVDQTLSGADDRAIMVDVNSGTATGFSYGLVSRIVGTSTSTPRAIYGEASGATTTNGELVGGRFVVSTTGAPSAYGMRSSSTGGATVRNYGVYSESSTNSGTFNIGTVGFSQTAGSNDNYGTYGLASNTGSGDSYSIYGDGTVDTDYAGYFNGNLAYNGTISSPSDRRLKENIKSFSNALSLVNSLKIYTYNYVAKGDYAGMNLAKGQQFGFIAQELEQVFPELVQEQNVPNTVGIKDGESTQVNNATYKSVNHIGMIPILTRAIQEQQGMIEMQQKRIEELEKKISKL